MTKYIKKIIKRFLKVFLSIFKKKRNNIKKYINRKIKEIKKYVKDRMEKIIKTSIIMALAIIIVLTYSIAINNSFGLLTKVGESYIFIASEIKIKNKLEEIISEYNNKEIVFNTNEGENHVFKVSDLGINFDIPKTIKGAGFIKDRSIFEKTVRSLRIIPEFYINKGEINNVIIKKIPRLKESQKNASVQLGEYNNFIVIPEKAGWKIDHENIIKQLTQNIKSFSSEDIYFEIINAKPTVNRIIAKEAKIYADKLSEETLVLKHHEKRWPIALNEYKNWITFVPEDNYIRVILSPIEIINYISQNITEELEIEKRDIYIKYDNKLNPTIEGIGRDGYKINIEDTITEIQNSILQKNFEVEISAETIFAEIKQAINPYGFKQILAEGKTNFDGSTKARIHNIETGGKRFQNIILAPGKQLSFLDILGPVSKSSGYLPELVIKKGGAETIKEYGGGLCQISSTVYRAALRAGLQIDKRRNHSYFVSYYTPIGLDATIYDPVQDLVFTNDTKHHILIQNEIDLESLDLYFRFWGTSDGRTVRLDGPFSYHYTGMPDPVYIDTKEISAGEIQLDKYGHVGFKVDWYRYILKYDAKEEEKELFHSRYNAIAPRYLRGI